MTLGHDDSLEFDVCHDLVENQGAVVLSELDCAHEVAVAIRVGVVHVDC
jgi:hypothetical protein